jgi:16S rRNA (guanine527-N7)-methyltransferase
VKHTLKEQIADNSLLVNAREVYQKEEKLLEAYIDLLLEWNQKINLVSRNVSRETLREHVVHSLLPIPLGLMENHDGWLDTGTGGGLPGIPLAICEPEKAFILNDNVRKKMHAVQRVVDSMKLQRVRVEAKSISLVKLEKGTGIVTKHAFKLPDLLKKLGTQPWKTIIMWKGADEASEELMPYSKSFHTTIFRFDFGHDEPFYEGKALVEIRR